MFKTFKLILFVCLFHNLCNGQTLFSNYYKTGYHNFFSTKIFVQNDSSAISFNFVQDSTTGRQDLNLLKVDKQGSILVNKTLVLNVDYLAYINGFKNILQSNNASFLATGVTYTNTNNNATIILNKINASTLDTIKTSYFDDNTFSYSLPTIVKLNPNKYYLIGNKWNSTTQWPVIFHIDSNLTILNIISLNNPINVTTCSSVFNPVTKKILFGGFIGLSSNQFNVGFIEADTLGVISNTAILSFPGIQSISQLEYSSSDNSYVFNGCIKTSTYGNNSMQRLQLTKLNSTNLNIIWTKTYGSASVFNNLASILINNDGTIVTCGRYSDSTSLPLMNYDTKGVILKTNANGDSLWMRQYNNYVYGSSPTNYQETFFGVEKTLDGGYILCGNVLNRPQDKAWIVKTDSLGCIYNGCGAVITAGIEEEHVTNSISIYPNPAADHIIISLNNEAEENYLVQITDITGKVLLSRNCKREANINTGPFSNGIYFVNLYVNDQLISTKKLAVIK